MLGRARRSRYRHEPTTAARTNLFYSSALKVIAQQVCQADTKAVEAGQDTGDVLRFTDDRVPQRSRRIRCRLLEWLQKLGFSEQHDHGDRIFTPAA